MRASNIKITEHLAIEQQIEEFFKREGKIQEVDSAICKSGSLTMAEANNLNWKKSQILAGAK